MEHEIQQLRVRGDDRGSLVSIEGLRTIPFEIRRVYYIWGTKRGVERGMHAHISLQQILICVNGACTIVLDDGTEKKEIRLDSPARGLPIGSLTWRVMKDFTEDAVLLVLANQHYDESDYIRNYDEFLRRVKAGKKDST